MTQRKRRMRTLGKMETDGNVWLLEHSLKVEQSKAKKGETQLIFTQPKGSFLCSLDLVTE